MSICHDDLPAWFGVTFDDLKAALASSRVNSRGWRLYLDHGDALFSPLRSAWTTQHSKANKAIFAATWLRLLQSCEMDVPPPFALSRSIARWHLPGDDFGQIPPAFLRATWKATMAAEYAGENVDHFVAEEVVPVAQWFFHSGAFCTMNEGQIKAGWEPLLKKFHEVQSIQRKGEDWPAFLLKVEFSGYRFLALKNEAALVQEGSVMSHCIGSYGDRCRYNQLRAWSVLEVTSKRHIATLAVEEVEPGRWAIDDLKGPGNTPVDTRIYQAAMGVIWCLEDAYANSRSIRAMMDASRLMVEALEALEDIVGP
jgi:hypothetical protein